MALHYFTAPDAESAVGGPDALREHFRVPQSTGYNLVLLEQVLGDTDGDVRTAIGLSFNLDSFDALWFNQQIRNVPPPPIPWSEMDRSGVLSAGRKVLRKYIWVTGSQNQAMPQLVEDDYQNGRKALVDLGKRLQSLSTQIHPTSSRNYKLGMTARLGAPPCPSLRRQFRWFT